MPDPAVLDWALDAVDGAAVIETVSLHQPPGRPSGTFRVRIIDRAGPTPRDFVVKVPVPDWIDPSMVATNAHGLQIAAANALGAPELIAADLAGRATGTPATLETWLPGTSALPRSPDPGLLEQAGAGIAKVHAIPLTASDELPHRVRPVAVDDFATDRRERRMATTALLQEADRRLRAHGEPGRESVFVHGDAHPGNMLWTGTGTVLIDWKTAGVGDPGVDLGDLRLQVALRYGPEAAAPVLKGWEEQSGRTATSIPYWDAVAALNTPTELHGWPGFAADGARLGVEVITQRRDQFLQSALARLAE